MFPCYKDEGLNFRVTTLFAVKTTTQSYLCRLPHRNKFPVNGGKPVALTIPEEFSVLLAEDGFPMCIPPHTTRRLSEIQSRKIVFCSMHFSLLSATLAPWKEKVNILFRKILFLCGLLKYSRKCTEFCEKVHHPGGQPPLFCRKSVPTHRDALRSCSPKAG